MTPLPSRPIPGHPDHNELTDWHDGPFDPSVPDTVTHQFEVLKLAKRWSDGYPRSAAAGVPWTLFTLVASPAPSSRAWSPPEDRGSRHCVGHHPHEL